MNERYIYGKLNKELEQVNYEGDSTDTIEVLVDNDKRVIKANYIGKTGETYVGGTTETAEVHINDVEDEKVITVDVIGGSQDIDVESTDSISMGISDSTISSNLIVNKEIFKVGETIESIWFDTSLSVEELGNRIISVFSDYDLSVSFEIEKDSMIGTYNDSEPTEIMWFRWEHNVTADEPYLMGHGTLYIYVSQQGVDITTVARCEYDWRYLEDYEFTYTNYYWNEYVEEDQTIDMLYKPVVITYINNNSESLWNGEFIRNPRDVSLIGVNQGKVFDTKINTDNILTTEKQYLTAEQQAQVLENLGLTELITQIKQFLGE